MHKYSDFIVEIMKYVGEKIDNLNFNAVDRKRLHNKIQIQIVSNIKHIAVQERSDAYREIDNIFNKQLLEEVSKHL